MKKLALLTLTIVSLSGCTPLINVSINAAGGNGEKATIKGESDAQATSKGSLGVGVGPAAQTSVGGVK